MTRPFVTLKLATSLDGRIATAGGESRWITGEEARTTVHALRAAHDAVLVGSATAQADDPELTVRTDPAPAQQPLRVILDTRLRMSTQSRLARTLGLGPVLVIAGRDADRADQRRLEAAGFQVALVARALEGVDLGAALTHLKERGVGSVLSEGGGRLAASLLRLSAVDRLEWFRAPILLGAEGLPALGELAVAALAQAPRFRRLDLRPIGADLWETYERA